MSVVQLTNTAGVVQAKLEGGASVITSEGVGGAPVVWKGGANPTAGSQASTKDYVDSKEVGIQGWHQPVVAASTGNVTLTSPPATLDGVTLSLNDRILLKDNTAGTENGIYVFLGAGVDITSSRALDFAVSDSVHSTVMFVQQGTTHADRAYVCSNADGSDVVGTDALTFVLFATSGTPIDTDHTVSAKFVRSTAQAVTDIDATGTQTPVNLTWTSETLSSASPDVPTFVTDTITINSTGWYVVATQISFDPFATGQSVAANNVDSWGTYVKNNTTGRISNGAMDSFTRTAALDISDLGPLSDSLGSNHLDVCMSSSDFVFLSDGDTLSVRVWNTVQGTGPNADAVDFCGISSTPCSIYLRKIPGM